MLSALSVAERLAPSAARTYLKRWWIAERFYDRAIVTRNYRSAFGRRPNLRRPVTFSEKVAYKMLFDRRPLLALIADKVRVRDYVAERAGQQFLSTVYQICESPDQIKWHELPDKFALKTNHGSKMHILVLDKSKLDIEQAVSQLKIWLGQNFYDHLREWCYRDIRPMVMVEELLPSGEGHPEWKFFVFDGRTSCVELSSGPPGDLKKTFYDRKLKRMNVKWAHRAALPEDPVFPENVGSMISVAERLGSGLDFVRVDLYNIDGRIVFGELTNYPWAGRMPFDPPEFDAVLGREWRCPRRYW